MIPEALVLDEFIAYATEIGKKIFSLKDTVLKHKSEHFNAQFALAFFILQDKKVSDTPSKFQQYYETLPWASVYNFPIMFNAQEHKWLDGTSISKLAKKQRVELGTFYEALCKECPEAKKFSFEDFLRVYMLVDSRVFIDDDIVIRRMVPMLDLANDVEQPNA
jgi:hypothetical protein